MPPLRRVLVLAPMSLELRPIVKRLAGSSSSVDHPRTFFGRSGAVDVVAAQIGVGPEQAAAATERLLDGFAVDQVVVSGIAGGIGPDASIGTVIVPSVVLDVASGRHLHPSPLGTTTADGMVGTVDELIMDPARLAGLCEQGVVALEMESSGVGSVCERRGVPWSVVRVVSDRPDDGLTDSPVLGALRPDGTTDPVAAARLLLTRPGRLPGLVRLGRDSSMAAGRAARATLEALG